MKTGFVTLLMIGMAMGQDFPAATLSEEQLKARAAMVRVNDEHDAHKRRDVAVPVHLYLDGRTVQIVRDEENHPGRCWQGSIHLSRFLGAESTRHVLWHEVKHYCLNRCDPAVKGDPKWLSEIDDDDSIIESTAQCELDALRDNPGMLDSFDAPVKPPAITGSPTKGAVTIKPVCHGGNGKLMADCGRCLTDAPCTIDVPAKPKPTKKKKAAPKCSGCGTVTDLGPCTADWCRHAEPLEFNPKGMMDSFSEITSVKMGPLTLMSKDGVLLMTCEPSADNKKWDQVGHCTIADGHTFDEVIHATLEQICLTQDEWTEDQHQYRCPKVN